MKSIIINHNQYNQYNNNNKHYIPNHPIFQLFYSIDLSNYMEIKMLNLVMAIIQLHLLNNQKSLYLMKSKSLNHSLILNQIYKSLKKMVKTFRFYTKSIESILVRN